MEQVGEVLGVGVYSLDSGHEIARIALHEDGVLGVVIVFVQRGQSVSEQRVGGAGGVEDETIHNKHDRQLDFRRSKERKATVKGKTPLTFRP
jgi:hypothetical protein